MIKYQYMKQTVRAASGKSAVFAVGMGLITLAPLTILSGMPARAWAAGVQEPATPQAGAAPAPDAAANRTKLDKPGDEPDPLKRQLSDKQKFSRQKELKHEISGAYKTWLNQDVAWI